MGKFAAAWRAFNEPDLVDLAMSTKNLLSIYDYVEVRFDKFNEWEVRGKNNPVPENKFSDN